METKIVLTTLLAVIQCASVVSILVKIIKIDDSPLWIEIAMIVVSAFFQYTIWN